jgi:hypothetical protein
MLAIRPAALRFAAALCLLPVLALAAAPPKAAAPMKLKFGGVEYVHRWSQNGQNEFTPPVQTDLKAWKDMVTVIVNERVTNGDQLAELANGVVGNYSKAGEILRTDSKPRTASVEAEHFIAAMLHAKGFSEAAFARVMMVEGRGVVVVYSRRAYGEHAADTIATFLDHNGQPTERMLMQWQGMPKIAQLRALPQAKGAAPARP